MPVVKKNVSIKVDSLQKEKEKQRAEMNNEVYVAANTFKLSLHKKICFDLPDSATQ